ncbi:hypothetical protein ACQ4LE_008332 [Meloidogyne hapla]|uniref:Candidate inclusion membrane protein n=1 Tax=Meloidogyne hapla TaxID=6305 RepID=A0A1I8BFK5_MELHA
MNNSQINNLYYYGHQRASSSIVCSNITSSSSKISPIQNKPKIEVSFTDSNALPPPKPVRNRPTYPFTKKVIGRNKSAQINWKKMGEAVLSSQYKQKMSSHSSLKTMSNIVIPKKRYSTWRKDSLRDFQTSIFTKKERRKHKSVPSSLKTVMALSGLFVCGLMLLLSGIIVIFSQKDLLFRAAGAGLSLIGLISLLICALLQRKNVGKWFSDMSRDLFALREAPTTIDNIGEQKRQSFSVIDELPETFIRQ